MPVPQSVGGGCESTDNNLYRLTLTHLQNDNSVQLYNKRKPATIVRCYADE